MTQWMQCPDLVLELDSERLEFPKNVANQGAELLEAILAEFPVVSQPLADAIRLRTKNRFHREACAFAEVAEKSWRDVMLANVAYDATVAMFGCSTVATETYRGPVLARNMDWWPEALLAKTTYRTRFTRSGCPILTSAGWPGSIGVVSGMSHRGFAITINAVAAPEGHDKLGYPVLLHIRRVLEDADSFEDALQRLSHTKITTGALFMLVGVENHQRVVIERTPTRHALRWGETGKPLVVTNDYRALDSNESSDANPLASTTCQRYETLEGLVGQLSLEQAVDTEALLYCLTDPKVQMSITAQHTIFRPADELVSVFVPTRLLHGP